MLTQHLGEEATTRFMVVTNYEYSDMKGKKMGLLIAGDQTSAWLKLAKELVKDNKKNVCIGECYAKTGTDGSPILVLKPEKGAAKKNLMKKQLEKFALKGTPFSIEIAAGGELEEDNPNDAIVDDVEVEDEGEGEVAPNRDAELQPQMVALIKEVVDTYKNQVQKVIDQIKAKKAQEDFIPQVENVLDKIDQLQELYDSAGEALQNRIKGNAMQVFGLAANLEKIKAKLNEMLGKNEAETTAAPVATNAEEAAKINTKLMEEINALVKEINLYALA